MMETFTVHRGRAAPLLRLNVDTDQIIPSREMKAVSKEGLGEGLFAGWRYRDATARTPDPDFVLNRPAFAGASILVSGANFGCGSSREHAVWALKEYGFRAILAPSFGAIFHNNCIRNGILPVRFGDAAIDAIAAEIAPGGDAADLTIDLPAETLTTASGAHYGFTIAPDHKEMLVQGLDPIALTLKRGAEIDAFQAADRAKRPWAYLS